ncbi:MAG: serine/threonine protein kinase, partial [Gracilibacteraceae bacterium]|nr:serine/threonine protein kinase [Gracilibacteraceae bacterium]
MARIIASSYEILEQIGAGGGGVVYLARHLRLGKYIAVKADRRKLSAKAEEALRREADTLKNLSHTYIPQVYDFVAEGETVYTVMDFVEGESLNKALERGERFAQTLVITWARQLLEALCYLHSRPPHGILHSDIKPANIMLTPEGDIRLIDFNIALALGEEGAVAVGRSHGYASPEHYQVALTPESATAEAARLTTLPDSAPDSNASGSASSRKALLDARSDVYSLGATLYHLLTGRRPAAQAGDIVPLTAAEVSPALAAAVNKAMAAAPEARFQTAAEMLSALNHLHENDPRWRRHKRDIRVTAAVLAGCFLISSFISFLGLSRMERLQSAYALAEYSAGALRDGDVTSAVSMALEALPPPDGLFVPPYAAQAQKALADALGVYDLSGGYKPHRTVELPSAPLQTALSPDGCAAVAVYAYEAAVLDMESAQITARLPVLRSALAEAEFLSDDVLVYAGENGLTAYDTARQTPLWTGAPATSVTVSADGGAVAAVYKDEDYANVYDADGRITNDVSFGGRRQWVAAGDEFANPRDNLFALNRDGTLLAASFADGSLALFDLRGGAPLELLESSDFTHFEGGFSGPYFAFSATGPQESVFAVVDTVSRVQTGGFQAEGRFSVWAGEDGIFVSADNLIVEIDPASGEQREAAYTGADVLAFARGSLRTAVTTAAGGSSFFDDAAAPLGEYEGDYPADFVRIAGEYALIGGRDTPILRIFRYDDRAEAAFFTYDSAYAHDEARVSADGSRLMLFSHRDFRLYGPDGELISATAIPEAAGVRDQQYARASGNLAVLYRDALRLYSGRSGELLLEKTGLLSVFYAPYGI